jgi:hypothetical protein
MAHEIVLVDSGTFVVVQVGSTDDGRPFVDLHPAEPKKGANGGLKGTHRVWLTSTQQGKELGRLLYQSVKFTVTIAAMDLPDGP